MANPYCTVDPLFALYDRRTMLQLSGDQNASEGNPSAIQTLLDIQASELESWLSGRYGLPLATVPLILTKWVAVTVADRLFSRRNDKPKQVEAEATWAQQWARDLADGKINLPGVDRAEAPTLRDSGRIDGSSQFDYAFGGRPSPTGPTAVPGQNATG